jgi:hypothetical protein
LALFLALLFHVCGSFAEASAEVIELRTTNFSALHNLDLSEFGGVNLENTLNTFAVGNLTDCERIVETRSATSEDDAFEDLDTLFAALDNARVNIHGVALREIRNIVFHLLAFDFINHVHCVYGVKFGKKAPRRKCPARGGNPYAEKRRKQRISRRIFVAPRIFHA